MSDRKFKLFVQDENNEVVLEYPIPTHFQGNGLGGGIETPVPDVPDKLQIASLFKHVIACWNKPLQTGSSPAEEPHFEEKCLFTKCDYIAKGRSAALKDANMRLHTRFKHEGKKVGK